MKQDDKDMIKGCLLICTMAGVTACVGIYVGADWQRRFHKAPILEEIKSPDKEEQRHIAAALPPNTKIRVGRIKPGTENDLQPVRSEWDTVGEWVKIVTPEATWELSVDGSRIVVICSQPPNGSRTPLINFNGVSNIVYLTPSEEF